MQKKESSKPTQDLRIAGSADVAGVERGAAFEFTFEGQSIKAYPGEMIGAALLATGISTFRLTRKGQPRGIFCGIGLCYDCLVVVEGKPNCRACLTPAQAGVQVRVQQAATLDICELYKKTTNFS